MNFKANISRNIPVVIEILFILVFLILLGGYAYRGIFSRYLQDDYCYSAEVVNKGFFQAQVFSYTNVMPFNSDRFSLTLFSGIAEVLGGPRFVPFLPVMSILVWLLSLIGVVWGWLRLKQSEARITTILVTAMAVLFFTLYMAPNLYQVLFWRSAMFPYLTPLVINTGLVGWFFYIARRKRANILQIAGFGVLSILAGGFSETAGFWQIAIWGFLFLAFWIEPQKNRFAIKFLLVPILGTILAIAVMALGPGNNTQLSTFKRPGIPELILYSLKYARDFTWVTLRSYIVPFGIIGCLGFFAGAQVKQTEKYTIRMAFLALLKIAIIGFVTVVAGMAPTYYAMSSYPGERALLPSMYTLVFSIFSLGWVAARWISTLKIVSDKRLVFESVVAVVGVVLIIYVGRTYPRVFADISAYQHRAEAWDLRNQMILDARAKGETNITVPAFDSIGQIFELYPDENFWVNTCAARYYNVSGISAVEGYNGVKPIFR